MNLNFKNLPEELKAGINELKTDLNIELCECGMEVNVMQCDGSDLIVRAKDGKADIVYDKTHHFFRCLSLLVQHLTKGETEIDIAEKACFTMNGPMYDVSQGGAVIRPSEIKKVLRQMAQLGLNMLMLYCEDSFVVEEQPYFGYMRPRYNEADIRECDDYAVLFGIEMIPCIQTLAHLVDVLKWDVYASIRENDVCLVVGDERTNQFVRDLITAASRPFRSKRIHIGMDEAYNLGRGKFLDRNGLMKPQEIMKMHLNNVLEITRELGLEPMMWSDMFFKGLGYHSDKNYEMPQDVIDCCPKDVAQIYWDYYWAKDEFYDYAFDRHEKLGAPVIFAGGIWTWIGYGPHWERTFKCTETALNVCKRRGIKEIFATIWGDNGTECLYNTNMLGIALFAEHGYAETIDYAKLKERFEFVTGASYDDFLVLEKLDNTPGVDRLYNTSYNPSKFCMWQDVLTGLCDKNIEGLPLNDHYAALAEELKPMMTRNGDYNSVFELSYHVANTLALKAEMGLRLTKAYKDGDREAMKRIADVDLPETIKRMAALREVHMKIWFKLYKSLGWDVMDMRYGSLITRMQSAITEINMYLNGDMERIEELEEERLYYNGKPGMISYLNWFGRTVSASRIAPYC